MGNVKGNLTYINKIKIKRITKTVQSGVLVI